MKLSPSPVVLLAWCALAAVASPALSNEVAAERPSPATAAPVECSAPAATQGDPGPLSSCFVQIECDDGSIVSCSGNDSCSTGGPYNRCVICDGVQVDCCAKTCCEVCYEQREACLDLCPTRYCFVCFYQYNDCVSGCTGGCP